MLVGVEVGVVVGVVVGVEVGVEVVVEVGVEVGVEVVMKGSQMNKLKRQMRKLINNSLIFFNRLIGYKI